jgi:hypothetical protein
LLLHVATQQILRGIEFETSALRQLVDIREHGIHRLPRFGWIAAEVRAEEPEMGQRKRGIDRHRLIEIWHRRRQILVVDAVSGKDELRQRRQRAGGDLGDL